MWWWWCCASAFCWSSMLLLVGVARFGCVAMAIYLSVGVIGASIGVVVSVEVEVENTWH